jgi:hypothetical protein
MFEKARDVYEEGLSTVVTVRDFSLIFDALTHFEESLISAKMQADDDDDDGGDDSDGDDFLLKEGRSDIDMRCVDWESLPVAQRWCMTVAVDCQAVEGLPGLASACMRCCFCYSSPPPAAVHLH